MHTPASIARHPIHPMLVPIPIGCWIFSLVCDVTYVLNNDATLLPDLAFWTMVGGIAGAVLAAIPGFIDMLSLAGQPKRLALMHLSLNATVIVIYAVNIGTRIQGASIAGLPLILSVIAVALLAVSGWVGGHMVYVHRVAVNEASPPRT